MYNKLYSLSMCECCCSIVVPVSFGAHVHPDQKANKWSLPFNGEDIRAHDPEFGEGFVKCQNINENQTILVIIINNYLISSSTEKMVWQTDSMKRFSPSAQVASKSVRLSSNFNSESSCLLLSGEILPYNDNAGL